MKPLISGKQAEEMLMWIRWANTDYLVARMMLLQGFLVQGSILATTTIEKYLKAVYCYSNMKVPKSHDVAGLYAQLTHKNPSNLDVNPSFLRLLRKAYKLRYPDELNDGFNIALNQAKLLAQLDRSVFELTKRFDIRKNDQPVLMVLDEAKLAHDQRILVRNVAVDPSQIPALFSQPSQSCDLRNHRGAIFEVFYQTLSVADDLIFELDGFVPQNDSQFRLAHLPAQPLAPSPTPPPEPTEP